MKSRIDVNGLLEKAQTLQSQNKGRMTLKQLRKSLQLTQENLAILLGVSKDTIRHYETGRRTPAFTVSQIRTLEMLLGEVGKSWGDLANDLSNPEKLADQNPINEIQCKKYEQKVSS